MILLMMVMMMITMTMTATKTVWWQQRWRRRLWWRWWSHWRRWCSHWCLWWWPWWWWWCGWSRPPRFFCGKFPSGGSQILLQGSSSPPQFTSKWLLWVSWCTFTGGQWCPKFLQISGVSVVGGGHEDWLYEMRRRRMENLHWRWCFPCITVSHYWWPFLNAKLPFD